VRLSRVFASTIFLLGLASASELKVKVVDPQSAAVSGAQVELFQKDNGASLTIATTSAEGVAVVRNPSSNPSQLRILAPGFAAETIDLATFPWGTITVQLHLAPAAETVVVTATRTPIPGEDSGANVETLSSTQLQAMNPVSANDALRFLPGAVVAAAGQRGGLSSLFVQGGSSTYNKVIVDGVTINEPGGTFDFGTLPLTETDHLEFLRGTQSTLYGSDAMTSVVQVATRTGSTKTPELRFGADGGNLGTASGYASLSGARGFFDYDLFGNQFNTSGQGPNDDYSNSLEGANLGLALGEKASVRLRVRHDNSVAGVQDEWNFGGTPLLAPAIYERARQNNTLASLEFSVAPTSGWQNHFTIFEDNQNLVNANPLTDPGREIGGFGDSPYYSIAKYNRSGVEYQGTYIERSWGQTTFGYRFEDENGVLGGLTSLNSAVRLNDDVYGQQQFAFKRLSVIAGVRFVHNGLFGNTGVPRVALGYQLLRGGQLFSGTRFRFSFGTGIKEPLYVQSYATSFTVENLGLRPERNRAFETGFQQNLLGSRIILTGTYFNNLFHDQIEFAAGSTPPFFFGQYENINKSLAHGAEIELQGRIWSKLSISSAYTYTSSQILDAPLCSPANFCDPSQQTGLPFILIPKHSATTLLSYLGRRWGANLGGSFVGRRPDSDFLGFGVDHVAGYARVDMGGWYAFNSRITAYLNLENAFDKFYEEVTGYPALGINFRAGMRFRIGGE
jgi:outer membrane cobalamin receptor